MRIHPIIYTLLVAVLSAMSGVAAGYNIASGNKETSLEPSRLPFHYIDSYPSHTLEIYPDHQSQYDITIDSPNPRYILRTDHGFVTVFYIHNGQDQPLSIKERTRTPASALSPEERKRLSDGIYIYTEEQLLRLLQDYGS